MISADYTPVCTGCNNRVGDSQCKLFGLTKTVSECKDWNGDIRNGCFGYYEDRIYRASCGKCGKTIQWKDKGFDSAVDNVKGIDWEITQSKTASFPYAVCGDCARKCVNYECYDK